MTERVPVGGLSVVRGLHSFIEDEALPGSGLDAADFWAGADAIIHAFAPRNRALLERRDELQRALDDFHQAAPGSPEPEPYELFLRATGYLLEEPAPFQVTTTGVDLEVSTLAGPQLVVPGLNARFAVNAANARWGSLYDALYGTDVIPDEGELRRRSTYNPVRGAEVISRGRTFLDAHFPLAGGSHSDAQKYSVDAEGLAVSHKDTVLRLIAPGQLVGYRGTAQEPEAVVLVHHGLHVEILIDRDHAVGASDAAGVKDIVVEAALSTIVDLEDSVAAVDADDKVLGYRNWLHLMQGTLAEDVSKDGKAFRRTMNPDRTCTTLSGDTVELPGRALLFVRQVGLLMTTDAVLDRHGNEIPEGILDALVTTLGSMHDLRGNTTRRNSRRGSMYIVKPKLHGPAEVGFTTELFSAIETAFGLPARTLKIGIMDEERRTSLNLRSCIHAARDRIAFINTGFLDRTGDEIHTSMQAGPVVRKNAMRDEAWIHAYELSNVAAGLACGLSGRAQIGKGMWAAPDSMAEMLEQKVGHPEAGATCAWVPSPTAATLHAMHYHQVDVMARQRELAAADAPDPADLRRLPLVDPASLTPAERQAELDNNLQGVLGYVVRWINAGVGCSKVPDISGVALMEDRATCRISSQHVANWLLHGVVTHDQVEATLRRMARVVDEQNAWDPSYAPMAPDFNGDAFLAARALVLQGAAQPNGYTEPILHRYRIQQKKHTPGAPR